MNDDETKLRDDIIHRLRMRGWSRIDAEDEADERIRRLTDRRAQR